MASTQPGAVARRRPRDRKQQIASAAATLFHRYGYGNVGTGDIAETVGITPGALYRHFPSKRDILRQAVDDVVDDVLAPVAAGDDLRDLVVALSQSLGRRRDLGILWHRESLHLDDEHRRLAQDRLQGFLDRTAEELAALRPELNPEDACLLAWFIVSTLTSPSYHSAELAPEQELDLLQRCALAVATTPPLSPSELRDPTPEAGVGMTHLARREGIVAAATRLFFECGYQATSMEDVGAAVGISGAAVYKHFASKSELLAATIARAAEPLQLGLTRALSVAQTAEQALTGALDEYIAFATVHHHLLGILVSEVTNLPDAMRHNVRRQQAGYVAEWVRLLCESRPELDAIRARYVVQSVLTTVNDATRVDRIRSHPDLAPRLRQVGLRLLRVEL